ncbi:MAG: hypothetical protein HDR02_17230 [Lachnospiraceae bacterium]|nr:hypothetical protein [Lachnospiraceae bacterium]
MEVIEVSSQIDTMLKLKKYDIYNNADIGDKEIKKIAEAISADKSIDLNEYFDLLKFTTKFCWLNFLKILENMPEEDRIRGLPTLFVLLQDANWPTFDKTIEIFETINKQVVESYLKEYLAQAYADDDEMWIDNMQLLAKKLKLRDKY